MKDTNKQTFAESLQPWVAALILGLIIWVLKTYGL
jgi:hypothetical protein